MIASVKSKKKQVRVLALSIVTGSLPLVIKYASGLYIMYIGVMSSLHVAAAITSNAFLQITRDRVHAVGRL